MNRYTADGLARAAEQGQRILVLCTSQHAANDAFRDFQHTNHRPSHVGRVNGAQHLDYPSGGSIHFRSRRANGYRGLTVDVLYLDTLVDQEPVDDAMPCIATGGELITA